MNDTSSVLLEAKGLRVKIDGKEILKGINLELAAGDVMALVGPNGAGKSTFLEACVGLRAASEGCITVCGLDPLSQKNGLRAKVGMYMQPALLPNAVTVSEAVRLFRSFYKYSSLSEEDVLGLMGLTRLRQRKCGDLSSGERQRLVIGISLIGSPSLLIMDEPASALDPEWRERFYSLLPTLQERGVAMLIATHQTENMERYFSRYAVMAEGVVVHVGEIAQLTNMTRDWPVELRVTVDRDLLRTAFTSMKNLRLMTMINRTLHFRAKCGVEALAELMLLMRTQGVELGSLSLRDASAAQAQSYRFGGS